MKDRTIDAEKFFVLIKKSFNEDDVSDMTKGKGILKQYELLDEHGKGIINWFMINITGYSIPVIANSIIEGNDNIIQDYNFNFPIHQF